MPDDYEVGYKRPPRAHQFKPGKSGNPKGRPKGSRSFGDEVRAALRKTITVNDGGRKRQINVLEAALRRLTEQAVAKGNLRAIRDLLALADSFGVDTGRMTLPHEDEALIASAIRRLTEQEDAQ